MADLFTRSKPPDAPLPGKDYLLILHKYLRTNLPRLAPSAPPPPSVLQQSYTLLTLGLDPSSQPLSRSLKVPLTLGFGSPSAPKGPIRPLTLRLPPDRLLYLLLRWQALPQNLAHVGRTDVPVEDGVPFTARGAAEREGRGTDGDVQSVRSWVGSMRSVSVGSMGMGMVTGGMKGWWGKEEPNEGELTAVLLLLRRELQAQADSQTKSSWLCTHGSMSSLHSLSTHRSFPTRPLRSSSRRADTHSWAEWMSGCLWTYCGISKCELTPPVFRITV